MWGSWAYLAAIIDGYSRKIVDWPVDSRMRTSLDADALRTAIGRQRSGIGDVVIHSDRGCQYASIGFRALALANGVISSVGHAGICYD
jgi:transposase InsO family protein